MVFELSYEAIWPLIFGRYAGKVQIVEALKCLKCDQEGFAIICRIKILDKKLRTERLAKDSQIAHVETLYGGDDGSSVVFISGRFPSLPGTTLPPSTAIFSDRPPEFVGVDRMKASVVGEEKELKDFLKYAEETKMDPRILSLASLKPRSEPVFSALSTKQKQSILTAYNLGYYDIPRRISTTELAKLLKVDKSTLAEHLRKAEKAIITGVLTS